MTVAIACLYAQMKLDGGGQGYSYSPSLKLLGEFVAFIGIVFVVFFSAPTFMIFRAVTASPNSGVVMIIYLTCAISTYFLYGCFFKAIGADVRGFLAMLALVTTWAGAFFCISPK
jgi:hypothetical protein